MSRSGPLQPLHLFIASPGDVAEEKTLAIEVIRRLENQANSLGYTLKGEQWWDCPPGMGRAQGVIFDQLPPETWDLYIGILWSRFGLPSGKKKPGTEEDYGSGTYEEFCRADQLLREHKRPEIMIYHGTRDIPQSRLDPDQYKRLKEFLAEFEHDGEHPGLVKPYATPLEFKDLLTEHLLAFLRRQPQRLQGPTAPPPHPPWQPGVRITRFYELQDERFAGRGAELLTLEAARTGTGDGFWERATVIQGGAGHGKTTLARQHAWRQREHFSAILFIDADTPALLDESIARLAGPDYLALGLAEDAPVSARMAATLAWLGGRSASRRLPRPWLLIIDNLDDESLIVPIVDLVWQFTGGQIIITSRIGQWPRGVRPLRLGVWSRQEAVDFLDRRLAPGTGSTVQMEELAGELGYLPLALEQAASYLDVHAQSIAAYLNLLPKARNELLSYQIDPHQKENGAVATTWAISRRRCRPLARFLLRLAAFFAPEPLPRFLFERSEVIKKAINLRFHEGAAQDLPERDQLLKDCDRPTGVEDALTELRRHSLITLTHSNLALHRLLFLTERDSVQKAHHRLWHHRVLLVTRHRLPNHPSPDDIASWDSWNPLATHLETLLREPAAQPLAEVIWMGWLLNAFGGYVRGRGDYKRALEWLRKSLKLREKVHPPGSNEISSVLSNLASTLRYLEEYEEAEDKARRALAITEKNLGPSHEKVGRRLNSLASVLLKAKKFDEAEVLLRRALAITEKSRGMEHHYLGRRLMDLGSLLLRTDRLDEAEEKLERSRSIRTKACGERHPDTARTLGWLAQLRELQNRLDEALELRVRALDIVTEKLGATHPLSKSQIKHLESLKIRLTPPE